jgi:hypothetical protein
VSPSSSIYNGVVIYLFSGLHFTTVVACLGSEHPWILIKNPTALTQGVAPVLWARLILTVPLN